MGRVTLALREANRLSSCAAGLLAAAVIVLAVGSSQGKAQAAPSLVAAYSFNEGTGTTVADASGTGNGGTIGNAAWTGQGKYGGALVFNGTSARVTVPDAPSLRLTSAMTLEAWVYPTTALTGWRDVIFKGDDNYYLMGSSNAQGSPAAGGIFAGSADNVKGTAPLPANTWTHLAATYDGAAIRLYVNGVQAASQGEDRALSSPRRTRSQIGGDSIYGQYFTGRIDEVRVYGIGADAAQIQADMAAAIGGGGSGDTTPPSVSITSPTSGSQVSGAINVAATASDNVGVVGVQLYVDGAAVGPEDTSAPYSLAWDTRSGTNGSHTLAARARDAAGNTTTSTGVSVTVSNAGAFQNEVLATGLSLPTSMTFLPDGRMLVTQLQGTIRVIPPPYTTPSPTPFLQITNIGSAGVQQGIYNILLDPSFSHESLYYVFYTLGTPNHDRLSRFTANSTLTGTVAGSELVLYEDPQDADAEHHGGAMGFGNDGKLYFATGEHFIPSLSQDPDQSREASSTGSTRTAPCRPTTRSTTAPARTSTPSGRAGCGTRTEVPSTRRAESSTSGTSAATTRRLPGRSSTSVCAERTTDGPTARTGPAEIRTTRPRSTPTRTSAATPASRPGSCIAEHSSPPLIRGASSLPTMPRTGSRG